MMREVQSPDGRIWTVQSTIQWSQSEGERFENDMAAGYVSGIAMLGVLLVLVLFVVFSTPPGVVVPSWLVLSLLLLLMVLPIYWAWRRPWIIEARTEGPVDTSSEHWRGTAYGIGAARQDTHRVIHSLSVRTSPDDGSGLLQQVT